jgi:hypothetical protein
MMAKMILQMSLSTTVSGLVDYLVPGTLRQGRATGRHGEAAQVGSKSSPRLKHNGQENAQDGSNLRSGERHFERWMLE